MSKLTSVEYLQQLAATIDPKHATKSATLMPDELKKPEVPGQKNTTHISVVDKDGNAAALTTTINFYFGSCVVAKGTGVLLNDEMDDFASQPGTPNVFGLVMGEANAIAPKKIPVSSMTPTLVFQKSLFDDPGQRKASQYITRFRDTGIDKGLVGAGLEHFFGSTLVQHVTATIAGVDKAAYLDEWGQPGAMTAMLNWYRASSIVVPAPGEAPERPAWLDAPFPPVTQPTLVIWGMADKALLPVQLDGLDALVPDLTVVKVDAGHFVPWEAPDAVTKAMQEWLAEREG